MGTRTLKIQYPEDLPEALDKTPEEFERELRFLVGAKLYEMGRYGQKTGAGWQDIPN